MQGAWDPAYLSTASAAILYRRPGGHQAGFAEHFHQGWICTSFRERRHFDPLSIRSDGSNVDRVSEDVKHAGRGTIQ